MVDDNSNDAIWSVFCFFFYSIFLGMKNKGSTGPYNRGGPWTWGPGFVLSLIFTLTPLLLTN